MVVMMVVVVMVVVLVVMMNLLTEPTPVVISLVCLMTAGTRQLGSPWYME